jgi:energy-coupling factor transporter transmembrane protein EcfT
MPLALELAQHLQDTSFGTALAESRYVFPIIEGFHLIGLSLSVGLIALIDLRLVGAFLAKIPLEEVLRSLRPWVLWGFALTFVSGATLFTSEATTVITSPVFPYKVVFVALAGLNALYFELRLHRWNRAPAPAPNREPPSALRVAGWASLGLWTLVVASGRLLPYIPH